MCKNGYKLKYIYLNIHYILYDYVINYTIPVWARVLDRQSDVSVMYTVLYNEGAQKTVFVSTFFTVHVCAFQWWRLNLEWLTKPIWPFFSRLSGSTWRWGRRSGSRWSGPGRSRWTWPTRASRLQGGRHATHDFLQLVYTLLVIPILSLQIAKLFLHLLFLSAFSGTLCVSDP